MDYIIIHDRERSHSKWIYVPSTNTGKTLDRDIETEYAELMTRTCGNSNCNDVESYVRWVESINGMSPNSLYYDQPNLLYEFW